MVVQKALGLENEYGEKIDKCLTDTFIKVGAGLAVGGLFSMLLFKRKAWPVTLGGGIGIGIAYSNCQTTMRYHYLPDYMKETPVQKVKLLEPLKLPPLTISEKVANIEELPAENQSVTDTEKQIETKSINTSEENCEQCTDESS